MELTPEQIKEYKDNGHVLEVIYEDYYEKCTNDPNHLCDECMKIKCRKKYIIKESDYVSPGTQKIKNIIDKVSNGKAAHANLTFNQKKYLESSGYKIRYQRNYKIAITGKNYKITQIKNDSFN